MCCQTASGAVCGAIFLLTMAFLCQAFSFAGPFWEKDSQRMTGLWLSCTYNGQCVNFLKFYADNIHNVSPWTMSVLALETGATFLLGLTMFISCCLAARPCRTSCGFVLSAFLSVLSVLCIVASLAIYATRLSSLSSLWLGYWMGVPAALLALIATCVLYRANSMCDEEEDII